VRFYRKKCEIFENFVKFVKKIGKIRKSWPIGVQTIVFYIYCMSMFDYISLAKSLSIDSKVLRLFEQEAKDEFPNDMMLRELHIMRALKAYSNKNL
jgi:hypothetical protein